jgi:putative flippase GtrA
MRTSLIRWLFVGAVTFVIDYTLFLKIFEVTNLVAFSNAISAVFSLSFNFSAHYIWTFRSSMSKLRSSLRYLLNSLGVWLIATSLLKTLIVLGVQPEIAKFFPTILLMPLTFLTLKKFVYQV